MQDVASPSCNLSPEIDLVKRYNDWFGVAATDPEAVRARLLEFVSESCVLNEPVSVPWGGKLIGLEGWMFLLKHTAAALGPVDGAQSLEETGDYWQRGNIVLREMVWKIAPAVGASEPFEMDMIERYTIEEGKIVQIDEYYSDTANLLKRMTIHRS